MIDIGGIEVVSTGSRLLTAEDVTEVTAHIERLESENAKLREQVADACMQLGGAWVRCTELRELIRDMWMMQEALPYGAHIEIADRMRELGIEVNT